MTEKWVELHGDCDGYDDPAIVTCIGSIQRRSYLFIGHQKGRKTKENIMRNFAMPTPHAVDFSTGDDPWPKFMLQKEFNAPGKSPPLSTEFYTGWLTHWGEHMANTDAAVTTAYLERILSRNGSVVLYMAHGGTNFGFYIGANTGADETDYQPDLTSYDYVVSMLHFGVFKFRFRIWCVDWFP